MGIRLISNTWKYLAALNILNGWTFSFKFGAMFKHLIKTTPDHGLVNWNSLNIKDFIKPISWLVVQMTVNSWFFFM